jgi:hypothetical protein
MATENILPPHAPAPRVASVPISTPGVTLTQGSLTRAQSTELGRRRRGRNIAMLVGLLALCALFYAIAIVKLSGH